MPHARFVFIADLSAPSSTRLSIDAPSQQETRVMEQSQLEWPALARPIGEFRLPVAPANRSVPAQVSTSTPR